MARLVRPPGPRSFSLGGSFSDFRADPLGFLTRCTVEYGDLVYFRAGHQHMYFLNSPELVQEALVTKSGSFMKSRILQRAKVLLGEGLLTNEGASHLRQRRLVQPAFHRDRLIRYATDMSALAVRSRGRFADGAVIDMDREMMRLTLAIGGGRGRGDGGRGDECAARNDAGADVPAVAVSAVSAAAVHAAVHEGWRDAGQDHLPDYQRAAGQR
jgi:cytochrome P450